MRPVAAPVWAGRLGRHAARLHAQLRHALFHFGEREDLGHFLLDLAHDLRRGPAGRGQRGEQAHVEIGDAGLGDGRHVRDHWVALSGGDGERAHLAGLEQRHRRRHVGDEEVAAAAKAKKQDAAELMARVAALKDDTQALEEQERDAAKKVDDLLAIIDRKSTRLNSSHVALSRMPSSA